MSHLFKTAFMAVALAGTLVACENDTDVDLETPEAIESDAAAIADEIEVDLDQAGAELDAAADQIGAEANEVADDAASGAEDLADEADEATNGNEAPSTEL